MIVKHDDKLLQIKNIYKGYNKMLPMFRTNLCPSSVKGVVRGVMRLSMVGNEVEYGG